MRTHVHPSQMFGFTMRLGDLAGRIKFETEQNIAYEEARLRAIEKELRSLADFLVEVATEQGWTL